MKRILLILSLSILTLGILNCSQQKNDLPEVDVTENYGTDSASFESLFDNLLANGFSYPFGDGDGGGSYTDVKTKKKHDGWYIATSTAEKYSLGIHTGEDWNGKGGGETDFGQPVYSTAKGKVLAAENYGAPWGNVVYIEHHYIENARVKTVYSLYAHLNEIKVKKGDIVKKRQQIGTIGNGENSYPSHLHFEIRKSNMKDYEVTYWPSSNEKDVQWVKDHYYDPSEFVEMHRKTKVPSDYDTLVVAKKSSYKMKIFVKGKELKNFEIALSQDPNGHKQKEGDLKLPEGEYYITEKNTGPFYGEYKDFFGPAWMRISYPNSYDAENAFKRGSINKQKRDAIVAANKKRQQPASNTGLGGGIGIHGWAGSWPENNRHLTWGCISMKNKELEKFYAIVPVGTNIFILP
ncbi:MAG: Chitin binding protein [Bacteroidetes bacterium]|jgi:murein L,D-transpeptidase YafK|nr:Chitin binding protein [Bacteroidota bacterium]